MRHTFWSCLILIRCMNMKWIHPELKALQSGHGVPDRQTDGQGETRIPPFNFIEAGGINKKKINCVCKSGDNWTTTITETVLFSHRQVMSELVMPLIIVPGWMPDPSVLISVGFFNETSLNSFWNLFQLLPPGVAKTHITSDMTTYPFLV